MTIKDWGGKANVVINSETGEVIGRCVHRCAECVAKDEWAELPQNDDEPCERRYERVLLYPCPHPVESEVSTGR